MKTRVFSIDFMTCPLDRPDLGCWAQIWRKRPDGCFCEHTYQIRTMERMKRISSVAQENADRISLVRTGDVGWSMWRDAPAVGQ